MTDFEKAEKLQLTGGDLALFAMLFAIEIVAAVTPDQKTADEKLEDVASRFMDLRRNITDERAAIIVGAFVEKLARTEEGSV